MPLNVPWSAAFSEAWTAYKGGSVPVGAVFTDATGELRFRGRNQVYSAQTAALPLQHTRLAHAELNVLVQSTPADRLYEGILYTTLEPCPMCVGAAVVCGIRHSGMRRGTERSVRRNCSPPTRSWHPRTSSLRVRKGSSGALRLY